MDDKESPMARMLGLGASLGLFSTILVGAEPANQKSVSDLQRLDKALVIQRTTSRQDLEAYVPAADVDIIHADSSLEVLLRSLPGVRKIELLVQTNDVEHTIIHIKDWHYLPKELFAADIRSATDGPIDENQIEQLYKQHLLEVELVQLEQMTLLLSLIRHHGLKSAYCEGLSEEDVLIYKAKIRAMRRWLKNNQVRIDENPPEAILQMGAVGRLALSGELKSVLPVESLQTLQRANPLTDNGHVKLNHSAIKSREETQVARLLRQKVSVVVLGGAHDLSHAVKKLGNGKCQYATVTTNWYARCATGNLELPTAVAEKPTNRTTR